jgi:hypothetical protein
MAELLPISMLEDKTQNLGVQLVSSYGGHGDAVGKLLPRSASKKAWGFASDKSIT